MRWIVGKTIDNYRTTRVLGRGGMGVVLEAIDESLDMTVALKLMDPMLSQDKNFKRRFQAEAKALARLQSVNIVRVLALRECEYGLYIVMEYVDGGTVADKIVNFGKLSWEEGSPVIKQLLKALGHAHQNGVIHLDIKPRNIMVTRSGMVKVTDFGLAKLQQDAQSTTQTFNAGTIAYMSPEQIRGRNKVDARSDIYSIGVTIYEMLSGRTPYDKTSAFYDLQKAILKGNPPSLSDFTDGLTAEIIDVVMKAIHKSPSRRFQSAEEMLEAIERFEKKAQKETSAPLHEKTEVLPSPPELTRVSKPAKPPEKFTEVLPSEPQTLILETGEDVLHYHLQEKVRDGRNGTIFRARDTQLNRTVALRFLKKVDVLAADKIGALVADANKVNALQHAPIVPVYEAFETRDYHVVASEWVKGNSLKSQLSAGPLALPATIEIALQIARVIEKTHNIGVCHLTLSPSQVMIDENENVRILGFGYGRLLDLAEFSQNDNVLGTFAYVAPELASGLAGSPVSDMFSLGVMLLEMCSGVNPFRRKSILETLFALINNQLVSIQKLTAEIPDQMVRLIRKSLSKEPEKRPPNMSTFIDPLLETRAQFSRSVDDSERTDSGQLKAATPGDVEQDSIDELFRRRERIDELLAEQFTQNITMMLIAHSGPEKEQEYIREMLHPVLNHQVGSIVRADNRGIMATILQPGQGCDVALEIRDLMKKDATSRGKGIGIRIALHIGDAVVKPNDILGDSVTLLEAIGNGATPGEILVSGGIVQAVGNQSSFGFRSTGKKMRVGNSAAVALFLLTGKSAQKEKQPPSVPAASAPQKSLKIIKAPKLISPLVVPSHIQKNNEPYSARGPIYNNDQFFGRKSAITKIYSRVGSGRPQSVSIVGEPFVGKSSLLNFIVDPDNRAHFLPETESFVFLYADFKDKERLKIPGFIDMIYDNLRRVFGDGIQLNVKPGYDDLKRVVMALDSQGYKVVMVFDNFATITRNRNFDAEFYSFLRSLANNYNIAYLVASGRNLQSVCHSREVSDSPFFNIFSNITLGQFTQKETLTFIETPGSTQGIPMRVHSPLIVELAGFHPFFLQIACDRLYSLLRTGVPATPGVYNQVREAFAQEVKPYFQWMWETFDEERHTFMLHIAQGKPVDRAIEYQANELTKAGYLRHQDGQTVLFSEVFRAFVLDAFGIRKSRKKTFRFWRS